MKDVFISRMREVVAGRDIAEFARSIGFKAETIRRYSNGERTPNGVFLHDFCKATGESSDWLLGLSQHRHTDHAPPSKLEYGAGLAAEAAECPGCTYLKAQLATVNQTLHNLSLGRSQPVRTSSSGPVKY